MKIMVILTVDIVSGGLNMTDRFGGGQNEQSEKRP